MTLDSSAPLCLDVQGLSVTCGGVGILSDLSLQVPCGEVHALLGPNGAGKSTLFFSIVGHPRYQVLARRALFMGQDLLSIPLEERARRGVFLGFQSPVEVPGLGVLTFLKEAYRAACDAGRCERMEAGPFLERVRELARSVGLESEFLKRELNVGFSGGEKKRFEMLQVLLLRPRLVLLDELDSGMDVDALKLVSARVWEMRRVGVSFLVISHYRHFLDGVRPDAVHVLNRGSLVVSSRDLTLIRTIEERGYEALS